MKELEATGIHVWTEEEGIIFLQKSQRRYLLGGTTTDHACDANSLIQNALLNSAAIGANALTLVAATGMTVGDNFGVVQNDGSAFWSTITQHRRQLRNACRGRHRGGLVRHPGLQLSAGSPTAAPPARALCATARLCQRPADRRCRRAGLERGLDRQGGCRRERCCGAEIAGLRSLWQPV